MRKRRPPEVETPAEVSASGAVPFAEVAEVVDILLGLGARQVVLTGRRR